MNETRFAGSDPYAVIPELYDLEHSTLDDDVELYRNLAATTRRPLLELACGSGRLLVPLARAGYTLTGLDQSAPMLARAAAGIRAADLGDRITLVEGTMADAAEVVAGSFGLVILALNGLLHLPEAAEQRDVLAGARQLLAPGGRLVIDILNPHPDFLVAMERGVQHEGSWLRDDGSRVDKFAARRVFSASQRLETDLWYDITLPDGQVHRAATSFPMRYVHANELELMLEVTGFSECQLYGSYDLDLYDDDADRMIAVAR